MTTATIEHSTTLVVRECGGCGILFALPADYEAELIRTHGGFCCPRGCHRVFTGETEAEAPAPPGARP